MADWWGDVETIRTTSDGAGRTHCVVTGVGVSPRAALEQLRSEAQVLLRQEAEEEREVAGRVSAQLPGPPRPVRWQPPAPKVMPRDGWPVSDKPGAEPAKVPPLPEDRRERRVFEVVDVRLVPARLEDGGSGWLAYGTLVHLQGS